MEKSPKKFQIHTFLKLDLNLIFNAVDRILVSVKNKNFGDFNQSWYLYKITIFSFKLDKIYIYFDHR